MALLAKPFAWFYHEFGLDSIQQTGRNAYLVIVARTCRMFAFGTNSLALALFFNELAFTDNEIGLFMTLTLLGDVILGLMLTLYADRIGRRRVLFGSSFMMIISGAIFAYFENFWILLLAAIIGVISATGGDIGPFRTIEESILSELTNPTTRADVLSWYITCSAWGSALGSEISGRLLESLQSRDGWNLRQAYHALFWMYCFMGIINAVLFCFMTAASEAGGAESKYSELSQQDIGIEPQSNIHSATVSGDLATAEKSSWFARMRSAAPSISSSTRTTMYKLWAMLALDSLSDGMVPYTMTNYYVDIKFHPSKATLGDITSVSYLLAAVSTIFAGPLARKIGLINTMVFTHIPSSLAVLLFPLPNALWLSIVLFFIRTGLNNMDQAPRAALIAAVVKPEERTAVMGITTMIRTLAATSGPTLTGALASQHLFWIVFVIGGVCRLVYDLGLYVLFVNLKLYQHETKSDSVELISSRRDEEEFETGSSDEFTDDEDQNFTKHTHDRAVK